MSWKPKRAPSTEFVCALLGIIMVALLLPADDMQGSAQRSPLLSDYNVFMYMMRITGGAALGALAGAIIAWADRRIG